MKRIIPVLAIVFMTFIAPVSTSAQFNMGRLARGAVKAAKALTLTDEQMAEYVRESVVWMDNNNPVAPADDPYAMRLAKLTEGITDADGIPLNFKVYKVKDVNAFACPDGSVRVFSALMDRMSDEKLQDMEADSGVQTSYIRKMFSSHPDTAERIELMTARCQRDGYMRPDKDSE